MNNSNHISLYSAGFNNVVVIPSSLTTLTSANSLNQPPNKQPDKSPDKQKIINEQASALHFIIKTDNVLVLEHFMAKYGISYQELANLCINHKNSYRLILKHCCLWDANKIIAKFIKNVKFNEIFAATNEDEHISTLMQFIYNINLFKEIFLICKIENINKLNKTGSNLLHLASHEGNIDMLEFLLSQDADINYKNSYNNTPLYVAIINGAITNANYLIEKGADLNIIYQNGESILMIALRYQLYDIAEKIIKSGADLTVIDTSGHTALSIAFNDEMHQALEASKQNSTNVENATNLTNSTNLTNLTNKVNLIIDMLIDYGCVLTNWGKIKFEHLTINWEENLSRLGIDANCCPLNVDKNTEMFINYINEVDDKGCNKLFDACRKNNEKVTRTLLRYGIDRNVVSNDKITPMYFAIHNMDKKQVKLLAESGEYLSKKRFRICSGFNTQNLLDEMLGPYKNKLYVCWMKCRLMLCASRYDVGSAVYQEALPRDVLRLILEFLIIGIYEDIFKLKNAN